MCNHTPYSVHTTHQMCESCSLEAPQKFREWMGVSSSPWDSFLLYSHDPDLPVFNTSLSPCLVQLPDKTQNSLFSLNFRWTINALVSVKLCVCVLSRFWFFATPWTVAHQDPLSMGFYRQEYWNGLPFPSLGDPNPEIEHSGTGRWIRYHCTTWKVWVCAKYQTGHTYSWLIRKIQAKGEEGSRGTVGWMASPVQWTWTWENSRRWGGTERLGLLQSMGSQRVRHNLVAEHQEKH